MVSTVSPFRSARSILIFFVNKSSTTETVSDFKTFAVSNAFILFMKELSIWEKQQSGADTITKQIINFIFENFSTTNFKTRKVTISQALIAL